MSDSPTVHDRAASLLDVGVKAAKAYDRPDLESRLTHARRRLDDPAAHILVVGEFKQGKSTLVNALLNVAVCPASDDIATVVPTMVRHGDEPRATAIVDGTRGDGDDDEEEPPTERRPVELRDVAHLATEAGDESERAGVRMVEVAVPRRILETGMAVIDTPGVGGFNSLHGAATEAALGLADLVLFVTDASQELTAAELAFLQRAHERCPRMVIVLTKIDICPHWRRIAEIDTGHLRRAGLDLRILPVSSVLRQLAHEQRSKELNDESGYPALVAWIEEQAGAQAVADQIRVALGEARFAIAGMEQPFLSEKAVLEDPESMAALVADLQLAQERAEALRSRSARWQQTLNDGAADLTADIDHDLRRRMRDVNTAAEEALDAGDPAKIWDEFAPWLEQRVASDVAANTEILRQRAEELAERVGDHFAIDEAAIGHGLTLPRITPTGLRFETDLDLEPPTLAGAALTAARGAYGGVLMFGFIGQLAGLALVNPLALVVGIGLGRKAVREERKRGLLMRQGQSKAAVRKHVDAVTFTAGKETRDLMKRVQRELRDEFTSRAEQLQASTREALTAADRATKEQSATRESRLRNVDAELGRLAKLKATADRIEAELDSVVAHPGNRRG